MIESYSFPSRGGMAARAIGSAVLRGELTAMSVFVAHRAGGIGKTESYRLDSLYRTARVTAFAQQVPMRTGQWEARAGVIELCDVPALLIVTALAAIPPDAFIKLSGMRIVVTDLALETRPFEAVRPCAFSCFNRVTAHAGYGSMGSAELEAGIPMLCGFETCRRKTSSGMAVFAGPVFGTMREFAVVIVLVTLRAVREFRILVLREIAAAVTLRALHAGMPSVKREARLRVIEISAGDGYILPPGGVMTLLAIFAERTFVMIVMAIHAGAVGYPLELPVLRVSEALFAVVFLGMARSTWRVGVFALERKPRLVMREPMLLPVRRGVATPAVRELTAMLVVMAVRAFRRKPEVRLFQDSGRFFFDVRSIDVSGIVAFPAFQAVMLSLEQKAGLLVLESSGIPADELEFASVMLFVAGRAFEFPCEIVVTMCVGNARTDFGMTCETIIPERFLSEVVALRAIAHAFEILVRIRQLPRRGELCLHGGRRAQNKDGQYDRTPEMHQPKKSMCTRERR